MTARQATFNILSMYKKGDTFTGWELRNYVLNETGRRLIYIATVLRYMRIYRRESGRKIVNVDKMKSVYEVLT